MKDIFLSDCFRQLTPEDQALVEDTPHFRKMLHLVTSEWYPGPEAVEVVPARLLEPGDQRVYHEPTIKKFKTPSLAAHAERQSAASRQPEATRPTLTADDPEADFFADDGPQEQPAVEEGVAVGQSSGAGDIFDEQSPSGYMDTPASDNTTGPSGGVPPSTTPLQAVQAKGLDDHAPGYFSTPPIYSLSGSSPSSSRSSEDLVN